MSFIINLKYNSNYKPILKYFNNYNHLTPKKTIFIKNYVYFYLFLNYFIKIFELKNFKLFFFKKNFYFRNILKSPNRHKKAQIKLKFINYFCYVSFCLNFFLEKNFNLLNNKFIYLYVYTYINFFSFIESALLTLKKKQIVLNSKIEI